MRNEIEEWKEIPNYKYIYEASSLGNVRSIDRSRRFVYKGVSKSLNIKGRVLKKSNAGLGTWYKNHVSLSKDGKKSSIKVIRLVAEAFLGYVYTEYNPIKVAKIYKDSDNDRLDNIRLCIK